MNIGIYIYDQAEVLDFSGPFEVFSTASRLSESGELFNTFLVGQTGKTITARGGFQVLPNFGFHDHPKIDVLIVVGGVHGAEMHKSEVTDWIFQISATSRITASVCTGAFLLAQSKVLTNQTVTTHWEDILDLKATFASLKVVEGVPWVEDENMITSAGISAGIDMSLHLVAKLSSYELAEKTARQMDYLWTKNE